VEGRIIDLSAGAAKKLGFYKNGTAKVLVEAIEVEG
jgi:rare lipoprotein A